MEGGKRNFTGRHLYKKMTYFLSEGEASLKNVRAERRPRDKWIELGCSREPSVISEKLGSGCSSVFQRQSEIHAGGGAAAT